MSRKLNFKDIMAFSLLRKNGFNVAIVSGEKNSAIEILANKFDIKEIHQNLCKDNFSFQVELILNNDNMNALKDVLFLLFYHLE